MSEYPDDLRYTTDHEWVRETADGVRVGITSYAQDALGDVVVSYHAPPGVTVDDIETTSKTLPDFPGMWQQMVGHP